MKKARRIILIILLLILFTNKEVSAKEYTSEFYTNKNNVTFTQEEYEFLSEMYWEGYQDIMTKKEYESFKEEDLISGDFETKFINENQLQIIRGASHSTGSKSLKISKSCSEKCRISVVLTWTVNPAIRSYDVIGAYFDGVSLQTDPITRVVSSDSTSYSYNIKQASNGVGTSVLLPSGSNIIVNQEYSVSTGGKVYASYQHAKQNTTLASSQKYNFSILGYGNVFLFDSSVQSIYDAMNGVNIEV